MSHSIIEDKPKLNKMQKWIDFLKTVLYNLSFNFN